MSEHNKKQGQLLKLNAIRQLGEFLDLPDSEHALMGINEVLKYGTEIKDALKSKIQSSSESDENAHSLERKVVSIFPRHEALENDNRVLDAKPDHTSFLILFLLDNDGGRSVNLDRICEAARIAGLSVQRNSLNSKLNRWRDPDHYSPNSKRQPLVAWDNPSNRTITAAGKAELDRLSKDIDPKAKARLIDAAKAA